jgi:hypothetical protein
MSKSILHIWLFVLHTICGKSGLETWLFPNPNIWLLDMKYSWIKNGFWAVNNKKWRKWCKIFSPYLKTHMAYPCSQNTSNVQIKYFMFDWSIYRIFVLNTNWKRDSLHMMILVNVCSTWSMVEIKTRFQTRIKIDLSGVSLFLISYLIKLMAYLCS